MIPYADSPFDNENVGEEVYFHILNHAKVCPYYDTVSDLDNEMITTLTRAAKSGIEVIIIMPHIPDKWYAFVVAKTYYKELIESGVQIYEYTPGFVHAKVFVADDDTATVGTINLDYRKLISATSLNVEHLFIITRRSTGLRGIFSRHSPSAIR